MVTGLVLLAAVGAIAGPLYGSGAIGSGKAEARARLVNAAGERVGRVVLTEDGKVTVWARARALPPGFHGFHVHAVGTCERPTFASAGGHFNPEGAPHPSHSGDMPVMLVNEDGTAVASFKTDRFRIAQLFDADGSAIIVHANPDNYANIPTDRYDPDPDATTLATGDAGDRLACGVLRRVD